MPEAFASSSRSIWAACNVQCPIPHGRSPGTPQKGLLGPRVPCVDGTAGDPGTREMLPRPALSLWAARTGGMSLDARGINSVELNDAKRDLVGGIGGDESNLCFKKTSVCGREVLSKGEEGIGWHFP